MLSPGDARVVEVRGLDSAVLDAFEALDEEGRAGVLRVWVADSPAGAPAVGGTVKREGKALVFAPRYAFQPGMKYRATFDFRAIGGKSGDVTSEFAIPLPRRDPVVRVEQIYPTSEALPENLLKFYIHFSGPMSRGEAYTRVRLLDDAGNVVPAPFLQLGEELWNPGMTRFTLFFDPGRIKQGLVPRMELGLALERGRFYTLQVDAEWRDGENRPLVAKAEKRFRVVPADAVQPNTGNWVLTPPTAGTREALRVRFDEPLDEAMLRRVLTVRNGAGEEVQGVIALSEHERGWSFAPATAWPAGKHSLVVQTILEDNAGNSIGRPFEVDLNQSAPQSRPAAIELPFEPR